MNTEMLKTIETVKYYKKRLRKLETYKSFIGNVLSEGSYFEMQDIRVFLAELGLDEKTGETK